MLLLYIHTNWINPLLDKLGLDTVYLHLTLRDT